MKILLWVSAIIFWVVLALLLAAWVWDLGRDILRTLSFARAWNTALRKDKDWIFGKEGFLRPMGVLWGEFWDLRDGVETTVTFTDGTKWNSEDAL